MKQAAPLPARLLDKRIRKLADWFVRNQVTRPALADCGRYRNEIILKAPGRPPAYSTNWTTGMAIIALLKAWRHTGRQSYLESARLAARYILSLQNLNEREGRGYGLFREETPQSDFCHPRDALSAAWGLLHLYRADGGEERLERVLLFARWFRTQAMKAGYPAWTAYVEKGRTPYWQKGSFHGGSPAFFFDLFEVTGNSAWKSLGLTICETWIRTFLKKDGSIRIEVDAKSGRDRTGKGPNAGHIGWQDMHKTNDDFTVLALLKAHQLTGRRKYLSAAESFLDWALTIQRADGAFGNPPVASAAATLILELLEADKVKPHNAYRIAIRRSLPYFLSLQELRRKSGLLHGGFYCTSNDYAHGIRRELGLRTSSYALLALLALRRLGTPCF